MQPQEPIHELEIEIRDAAQLMQAGAQARSNGSIEQEWTPFDDQILIFLNNIRMLIRYVAFEQTRDRPELPEST